MPGYVIDHKPVCKGNKTCIVCGRKGCHGCICEHAIHPPNLIGKCIVCAGIHTEDSVILFQPPVREWDK